MPRIVLSHWLVLNQSELLTFFDILPKVLNVLCNNPHIGLAGIGSLFIWLSLRACMSICGNVQQMNWFPNNKISYQDEIHQKARVHHLRDSLQTEPFTVYGKWPKSAYLAACSQGSMSRRNLDFGEIFHRYGRRELGQYLVRRRRNAVPFSLTQRKIQEKHGAMKGPPPYIADPIPS